MARPGIMLVDVHLHHATPANAATLLRWTKLHFRDLLSIPEDPTLGRVTRSMRFAAPEASKYLYTFVVDDIALFQSQPYYDVSRLLNLETTRVLGEHEEPVGDARDGAMVFEVCGAAFAVFEEVASGKFDGERDIGSYQHLPLSSTAAPASIVVELSIKLPSPTSDTTIPQNLQASLLHSFLSRAPHGWRLCTSLYRWAGVQAHPEGHPMIDIEAQGEWLVTLLVVDEELDGVQRERVVRMVHEWAEHADKEEGVEVSFGVWGGEVFMS